MKHFLSRVFLVASLIPMAGCLVSSSSNERIEGNYVPQNTYDQIEAGKSTAAWVKATLGEPSSKQSADDKSEVWKYSYTERKDSSGAVFLIFGGSNTKEQKHFVYVELKDGVVTKKWTS